MARDRHGQAVRATGLRHRANCFRRADALGDIGIAGGATGWNLAQGLPDPLLKRRTAYVERQVKADAPGLR
jgi:hypothetical protein